MKKILYVITGILFFTIKGMQQPTVRMVDEIFKKIPDLIIGTVPAEWENLNAFLTKKIGETFTNLIQPLSQAGKEELMSKIMRESGKWPTPAIISDRTKRTYLVWAIRRDLLAAIIITGLDINTTYSVSDLEENFLETSIRYNDLQGVNFALQHNAAPVENILNAKTLPIGQALLNAMQKQGTFEQFFNNPQKSFELISNCLQWDYEPRLLGLYSQLSKQNVIKNLNFNDVGKRGDTLLHILISNAPEYKDKPTSFFEKFLILYKAGAVNLEARNNKNQTPLDILNTQDQTNPAVKLAKSLLIGLKDNPMAWKHKLTIPANSGGDMGMVK